MMNLMRNASSPQTMLSEIASKNPQMKQIMDMVGSKSPKEVFMNACKDRNVDPDEILSMMK